MSTVKFKYGTPQKFEQIQKDSYTFYLVGNDLYLGATKISSSADLASLTTRVSSAENTIASLADVATSGSAVDVSITDQNFTATNVDSALTELRTSIGTLSNSKSITLTTLLTPESNDATTYVLSQGGTEIGRIHIGKDLVATKGELVSQDGSGNEGTFIKMTVANGTPFYIPVGDLIDIYQGSGDVGTVSSGIEIKVLNGVISADIKTLDGGKLDNGSVTLNKLDSTTQGKINNIDNAVFSITEGSVNGAISVDGTSVAVHGLGTAAFQNTTAFDTAGSATTVKNEVLGDSQTDTAQSKTIEGLIKKTDITSNTLANLDGYVGTIPIGSTSTDVVDYVSEVKNSVTGSATIASKSGNTVTLKAGVAQSNGAISNNSASDISLADIASTGNASDVSITDSGNLIVASTVEGALAEIVTNINGDVNNVVRYTAQSKTSAEKAQARSNIDAVSTSDLNALLPYLTWHSYTE